MHIISRILVFRQFYHSSVILSSTDMPSLLRDEEDCLSLCGSTDSDRESVDTIVEFDNSHVYEDQLALEAMVADLEVGNPPRAQGAALSPQSSVSSEPEFQGIHLLPLADASREFLESIGCREVPSLTDLGRTQVDVPADGSCGPHAVLAGLYELGMTPIYKYGVGVDPPLDQEQRTSRKHSVLGDIGGFRQGLYCHFRDHIADFTSNGTVVDASGDRLPEFGADVRDLLATVGGRIWKRGVDFSNSCSSNHWMDFDECGPIMAHMFRCSFVCYQVNNDSGGSTTIVHYSEPTATTFRVVKAQVLGRFVTPPTKAVCIRLKSNHYQLLSLNQNRLSVLFNLVIHSVCNLNALIDPSHRAIVYADESARLTSAATASERLEPSEKLTPSRVHVTKKKRQSNIHNTSASGYSGSCPEISERVLNSMSYTQDITFYEHFSHYVDRKDGIGKNMVYKPIDCVITAQADFNFLRTKIRAHVVHGEVLSADWICQKKADVIKVLFEEKLPEHIAIVIDISSKVMTPFERQQVRHGGKATKNHPFILFSKGRCMANRFRDPSHRAKPNEEKCTTTFIAGIRLSELRRFGSGDVADPFSFEMIISGNCVHGVGEELGTLRGVFRNRLKDEVSIHTASNMPCQRLFTIYQI